MHRQISGWDWISDRPTPERQHHSPQLALARQLRDNRRRLHGETAMRPARPLTLDTATERPTFDARTGRLIGLAPLEEPQEQLIASAPEHPVFVIQYLDEQGEYRQLDSHAAPRPRLTLAGPTNARTLTM